MPVIVYKKKLEVNGNIENISIAFNTKQTESGLVLKDYEPNYFDSGDFRLKIDELCNNFKGDILNKYLENKIYCLGIVKYFYDNLPCIFSIKFESDNDETIYYKDDLI